MTGLTAEAEAAGPGLPVVLRVAGQLDPESAPVLHRALALCLVAEPEVVVLDFAGVTRAGEDAIAAFVLLADRARAWPGATLVLGGANPAVAALLARAGVARHVPVYPSVVAALAGARAARTDDGTQRIRLSLPPVDSAAATARRLVDRLCAQWGLPGLRDTARLVATELVSNAVRHATTALELTLSRRADAVYISVRDHSPTLPRRGEVVPAPTDEGGRGLLVVDRMSRAWGSTPTADGKVVWASLATA
jgi:anti-anti-sigma regulatory factor/anti-sigma regulatory factor (Ser/Thr protein kinase)